MIYEMAVRFHRQQVWWLTLVLPALIAVAGALWVVGGEGAGPRLRSAELVVGYLLHVFPPLAAIFLLARGDSGGLDLLLVRPIRRTGILFGRWLGVMALFGGCHLLLSVGLCVVLGLAGGGPSGRVYLGSTARYLGLAPGQRRPAEEFDRPWLGGPLKPGWLKSVSKEEPWLFEFSGLPSLQPLRGRAWPLMARVFSVGDEDPELSRADSATAEVTFLRGEERLAGLGGPLELRDGQAVEVEIPAEAVGEDGILRVALVPVHGGGGREGDMVWSPSFFWFDPDGGGNRLEARDFTIVEGEVPFFLNALWAALEPLGKLILVTALAGAAAALFSPGIAFGLTLAVYVCASAHPFLQDVLSAFADESVLDLLGHAEAGHRAHSHVWLEKMLDRFQTALQGFLDFWLMVVPDFGRFRGGRLLAEGHAIRPGELLHSFVTGGGYAASFFLLAFPFLLRQEVRR